MHLFGNTKVQPVITHNLIGSSPKSSILVDKSKKKENPITVDGNRRKQSGEGIKEKDSTRNVAKRGDKRQGVRGGEGGKKIVEKHGKGIQKTEAFFCRSCHKTKLELHITQNYRRSTTTTDSIDVAMTTEEDQDIEQSKQKRKNTLQIALKNE